MFDSPCLVVVLRPWRLALLFSMLLATMVILLQWPVLAPLGLFCLLLGSMGLRLSSLWSDFDRLLEAWYCCAVAECDALLIPHSRLIKIDVRTPFDSSFSPSFSSSFQNL